MRILVVGATGRVGTELVPSLLAAGHTVVATSRKGNDQFGAQVEHLAFDLEALTSEMMVEQLRSLKIDAIYNVSGARGGNLIQIDLFGFVKLQEAAEQAGITRFIQLSTVFALEPERWTTPGFKALADYYVVKHFADHYLVHNTNLNYTVLQPGYLTEDPGTGEIGVNDEISAPATIQDVALTLTNLLANEATYRKVITMHTGGQPIAEALATLVD